MPDERGQRNQRACGGSGHATPPPRCCEPDQPPPVDCCCCCCGCCGCCACVCGGSGHCAAPAWLLLLGGAEGRTVTAVGCDSAGFATTFGLGLSFGLGFSGSTAAACGGTGGCSADW